RPARASPADRAGVVLAGLSNVGLRPTPRTPPALHVWCRSSRARQRDRNLTRTVRSLPSPTCAATSGRRTERPDPSCGPCGGCRCAPRHREDRRSRRATVHPCLHNTALRWHLAECHRLTTEVV